MKIASVLLGIFSAILMAAAALVLYATFYSVVAAKGSNAEAASVPLIAAVVLLIVALLGALAGSVLAVIALFKASENKAPALIGLALNILVLLGFVGTVLFGVYYLLDNVKGRPFG